MAASRKSCRGCGHLGAAVDGPISDIVCASQQLTGFEAGPASLRCAYSSHRVTDQSSMSMPAKK